MKRIALIVAILLLAGAAWAGEPESTNIWDAVISVLERFSSDINLLWITVTILTLWNVLLSIFVLVKVGARREVPE